MLRNVTHTAVHPYVVAELYIFRSQRCFNNLYLRQVEPDKYIVIPIREFRRHHRYGDVWTRHAAPAHSHK